MEPKQIGYLQRLQCHGAWDKKSLEEIGAVDDNVCDLCGLDIHTSEHSVWVCPKLSKERAEADKELAEIDPKYIHAAVKMGIAPAMSHMPEATFWGGHRW